MLKLCFLMTAFLALVNDDRLTPDKRKDVLETWQKEYEASLKDYAEQAAAAKILMAKNKARGIGKIDIGKVRLDAANRAARALVADPYLIFKRKLARDISKPGDVRVLPGSTALVIEATARGTIIDIPTSRLTYRYLIVPTVKGAKERDKIKVDGLWLIVSRAGQSDPITIESLNVRPDEVPGAKKKK